MKVNLYLTETLPAYSGIKNCWLRYQISEQRFFGDLNITYKLRKNIQRLLSKYRHRINCD